MELLTKLGVDWKLLLAQIVNFTIIVGVLSYFVYKPLLRLIDERRERIAKAMEDAKRIEQQKKELEEFRTKQLKKIDEEAGQLLAQAKAHAEKMKEEILAGAQKEAKHVLEKAQQQLTEERERVMRELQGTLASLTVRMTEKILEREFSDTDQKRFLASIEKELPQMLR
jgi:F-type H+-transporting ATPase subunit b